MKTLEMFVGVIVAKTGEYSKSVTLIIVGIKEGQKKLERRGAEIH